MTLSDEQQLGRAKNALLSYFERRLSVPKIFIDANWAGSRLDVLAIDRDGVGDVHVVLLFVLRAEELNTPETLADEKALVGALDSILKIPAHFKYVGAVDLSKTGVIAPFGLSGAVPAKTFAPDGVGRVGYFTGSFGPNGEPRMELAIKPERFRAFIAQQADAFLRSTPADWEIRPDPVIEEFHA